MDAPATTHVSVMPAPGTFLGTVAELRRYPVKSMQGETVNSLEFDIVGAVGDRRWAVRDEATGRLLQARTTRPLIHASARLRGGVPVIRLPDGAELEGAGAVTDSALSAWLGRAVRLAASEGDGATADASIELPTNETFATWWEESRRALGLRGALSRMRAGRSAFADGPERVLELPSLPGSFNDCEPAHLLSLGELAAARAVLPAADWDARRFRPNVVVDDRGGDAGELAWIGWTISLGEVELAVTEPTLRCAMTTVDQPGLIAEPQVLRTLAAARGAYFGRYARVVGRGTVSVGDEIRFLRAGEVVDGELFRRMRSGS